MQIRLNSNVSTRQPLRHHPGCFPSHIFLNSRFPYLTEGLLTESFQSSPTFRAQKHLIHFTQPLLENLLLLTP